MGITGLFLATTLLGGCSNRMIDHGPMSIFSSQPMPGDSPSPVRSLSNGPAAYPNLASVPPRPTDFSTPEQRLQDLESLSGDRAAAHDLQRAAGIPTPAEVPPAPELIPGKP
jgi:hypothetical protein